MYRAYNLPNYTPLLVARFLRLVALNKHAANIYDRLVGFCLHLIYIMAANRFAEF